MKRYVLLPLILVFAGACSTTATISRARSGTIDAKIVRSTSTSIFVETAGGQEMEIARDEITDIDHPGNGMAITGGILGAYGILNIITGAPQCEEQGTAFCVGVFLPATVGTVLFIRGINVWGSSTSAAEAPKTANSPAVPVTIAPVATKSKEASFLGAVLTGEF